MSNETVSNLETELVEIMDRIEGAVKSDKSMTSEQKTTAIVARDYIYIGLKKLGEINV